MDGTPLNSSQNRLVGSLDAEHHAHGLGDGCLESQTKQEEPTIYSSVRRILFTSWINILLLAIPLGITFHYCTSVSRIVVFVINCIAIIPLAAMLSLATEDIALRIGGILSGLLTATLGNAVELIVAIIALVNGNIVIVKTSLLGSVLSNLLLVLGLSFLAGGLTRSEQHFNITAAQTNVSVLFSAASAFGLVTSLRYSNTLSGVIIAKISHGISVVLLSSYAAYLFFGLRSHRQAIQVESQKVPAQRWHISFPSIFPWIETLRDRFSSTGSSNVEPQGENGEEEQTPELTTSVAVATLVASTAIIAICAEFMVSSIDAITKDGGLSVRFVGLIIISIAGNAAEHVAAITSAIHDNMNIAVSVAIGSSVQVAAFLVPLLVIIGWGLGSEDMNLDFGVFESIVMIVAVLLASHLVIDAKSNWLEGWLLISFYATIAIIAFFYN